MAVLMVLEFLLPRPPRALTNSLDHDDFLAAMAPGPLMILPKEKDYFDIRGSFEAHSRLKKLYGLLGAEENIALKAGPTPHGFTQENRESIYRWFNQSTAIEAADETTPVFTVDVRGVGESLRGTTRSMPLSYYGPDYLYTAYSNMLGYDEIHLVGKGWGTVPATFAALLSPAVKQVTLKNALLSYEDIATTEQYGWPNSIFLPGVLKSFDLPDCYKAASVEATGSDRTLRAD